jgi:hypothetical protein
VICAVEYIYLLWILYRLLSGVSKTHASLMVIFGVAFVPIMCMNAVSEIAALMLLRGADFLPVFNQPQRESLAMLFLGVRRYGYDVGWIFGLWLFHFGVCVEVGFPTALPGRVADCCMLRLPVLQPYNVFLPSYVNIVSRLANIPLTSPPFFPKSCIDCIETNKGACYAGIGAWLLVASSKKSPFFRLETYRRRC